MDIYFQKDYRDVVKKKSQQLKAKLGSRYSFQQLSDEIGIQRTYLSKVLNKGAHLNEDQLYLILDILEFSQDESEYLTILHGYQRSASPKRRKHLKEKILKIQRKFSRTEEAIPSKILKEESSDFAKYYLNPHMQLVHLFTSMSRFADNTDLIAEHLNLHQEQVNNILSELLKMGIIRLNDKGKIIMGETHLFLSADSPYINAYHNAMRTHSAQKLNSLENDEKYVLTMLISSGLRRGQKVRRELVDFCKSLQSAAAEEKNPSEAYQLNVEFFPWTK